MPRPTNWYIAAEPLEPLTAEEVRFWLRIMQEHAVFIKAGLPCDSAELISEAQVFYQDFEGLRARAERGLSERKFGEFISDLQDIMQEFYLYKRNLLHLLLECRLGGSNFPLFIDHLSREAEYFLRLLEKGKAAKAPGTGGSKARENAFWLRIMADHTKFISQALDPSEYNLIATAMAFSEEFDRLYLQGMDFASMLQGWGEVASFRRFLQDVRAAVMRLRDFKRAAEEMIADCRLLGILPAEMADHVRREAEHFLLVLGMLDKSLGKAVAPCGGEGESCCEREQEEVVPPHVSDSWEEEAAGGGTGSVPEPQDSSGSLSAGLKSSSSAPVMSPPVPPEGKYKWSGKWPRQLGKKEE